MTTRKYSAESTANDAIDASRSLSELLDVLRIYPDTDEAGIDMSQLPVFGGGEPVNTLGVWSWDGDHLLVGSCVSDMQIITRAEFADR